MEACRPLPVEIMAKRAKSEAIQGTRVSGFSAKRQTGMYAGGPAWQPALVESTRVER